MSSIKHRELKMQEKRKHTPRREFVKEICSWHPLTFSKNNGFISMVPVTERFKKIVSSKEFEETRNNEISKESNNSLFETIKNILKSLPIPTTFSIGENNNSTFSDLNLSSNNCYLSSITTFSENILYSLCTKNYCKNIYNSIMVSNYSENIYFSQSIVKSYNVFFSKFTIESSDIRFSKNLIGCKECLMCNDIQNKSYCIENKQYTKEDYLKNKKNILNRKEKFQSWGENIFGQKAQNISSTNIKGESISYSEDIENGYMINQIKKGRNLILSGGKITEHIYDSFSGGSVGGIHIYGGCVAGIGEGIYNSFRCGKLYKSYYCMYCDSCSYCLGCIGLKNKSFCILNKQYTKEEWFEKANEIFQKMESDGELGQFFPGRMNPFYFNDTVAYLIDPSFTKEEVEAEGYLRRDEPIKVDIPAGVQTVQTTELDQFEGFDSQGKRTINDEILKKVIIDESGNAYRIIPMELEFLRKYELPLPRLHWLERIKLGFRFG